MDHQKRQWLWLGIMAVLVVAAGIKFFLPVKQPLEIRQEAAGREIVVYVAGAVREPGLLRLPLDSRLNDALELAGLLAEADASVLNPAQALKDGQKIVVPYLPAATQEIVQEGSPVPVSAQTPVKTLPARDDRVNINQADVEELKKIPGIGPVLAERIVRYREENGGFGSPEEIKNVSGIGTKTYEKMAAHITVGY